MLFPTVVFCAFFLVVLAIWWSLPAVAPKTRTWVLLAANIVFYAYFDLRWAGGLIVLASGAWLGSLWIAQSKNGSNTRAAKGWVVVIGLLSALFTLKYVPWLAQVYNTYTPAWNWQPVALPEWAYPAGLSFFTFHALALVLSVWHDRIGVPKWTSAVAHVSFIRTRYGVDDRMSLGAGSEWRS